MKPRQVGYIAHVTWNFSSSFEALGCVPFDLRNCYIGQKKKKTNATDFLVPQVIGDSNLKDINK